MGERSKPEKLLLAAGALVAEGKDEFSAEQLIIKAWEKFPEDFSLKGEPKYPNSNAVLTLMMGKKAAVITKGWLEKTGAKLYRMTAKGLHDLSNMDDAAATRVYVERKTENRLGPLLFSPVFDTYKAGNGDEITFHQFCRFASLSARDKWQKVEGSLRDIDHVVEQAVQRGETGDSINLYFRGQKKLFGPDDLRLLGALVAFLKEKFKSQMDGWKRNAFA